ncbi:MAG: NUDIX hydrolase [Bacteroidota bacterium]
MSLNQSSFDQLAESLRRRLGASLPGEAAHSIMRAMPLAELQFRFSHQEPPRPGSVLLLLVEQDGVITFPMILRPSYDGAHGGQVSLPGGKAEDGESPEETALREAAEEIGIDPASVELIGRLSDLHVIPSNFMVTPVVGLIRQLPEYRPDPHEVETLLTARLHDLLSEEAVSRKEIEVRGHRIDAPYFLLDGHVVWGATAMILNEFRSVISGL